MLGGNGPSLPAGNNLAAHIFEHVNRFVLYDPFEMVKCLQVGVAWGLFPRPLTLH